MKFCGQDVWTLETWDGVFERNILERALRKYSLNSSDHWSRVLGLSILTTTMKGWTDFLKRKKKKKPKCYELSFSGK